MKKAIKIDMNSIPRAEYPRPQFVRKDWLCLNGKWDFEFDPGISGIPRGLASKKLKGEILVPFCPESVLSGVGDVDFHNCAWYARDIKIPASWSKYSRIRLHFQACDYETFVFANGEEVMRHRGGYTPFFADITKYAHPGETVHIAVRAVDENRMPIPAGKQCCEYDNVGCSYTRTTGIWQTVWLEPLPRVAFERPRITPDLANRCFNVEMPLVGNATGVTATVTLKDKAGVIAEKTVAADLDFSPSATLPIPAKRLKLWEPGKPFLYDIIFTLKDAGGNVIDTVKSYAGMRSVRIDGLAVKINSKPVFQRLVLDQGYYADGIYTAPTEQALIDDIKLSMEAGFNGARLHQKVFEERFLYHCDKLGYMVWDEFPDWGMRSFEEEGKYRYHQVFAAAIAQWQEEMTRDYSHPSIVGWCPLNETWQTIYGEKMMALDDVTAGMYNSIKNSDRSRPVLDASGYSHRIRFADVYDSHDYDQDPVTFKERHAELINGKAFVNENTKISVPYEGQPYFVSEFGGIKWSPHEALANSETSWGYGAAPRTIEEFYDRFEKLCGVLLDNPAMFGYCYTQLTDVFQEQNGIYFFDRSRKFDMARIRKAQVRKAAIEKGEPEAGKSARKPAPKTAKKSRNKS